MKKSANAKLLNDATINGSEKLKLSLYVRKQSIIKANSLVDLTECSSRNDVIEKAIDFYFGFVTSQLSQEFLCSTLGSKMDGLVGTPGTRIARGNFRAAVETDMLTRMLASVVHVTGPEYNKLRRKSIEEVKRTNGAVDILKAEEDTTSELQSEDETTYD